MLLSSHNMHMVVPMGHNNYLSSRSSLRHVSCRSFSVSGSSIGSLSRKHEILKLNNTTPPPGHVSGHVSGMGRSLRRRSRECSARVAVDGNSNSSSSPAGGAGGGTSTTTSSSSSSAAACDKYFEDDTRPIVLFDGVCMLCNGGVDMMLRFDTNANARFAALQSEAGQSLLTRAGRAPDDISSIVLCESDGTSHVKSDAILRIAQLMDIPFRIIAPLGFLFPSGFRDGVYDVISENRYKFFGSAEACRFRDPDFNSRFVE